MSHVAIIDLGAGNVASVCRACEHVGMDVELVSSSRGLHAADAAILPGVGAFGAAIDMLDSLGLTRGIVEFAQSGRPLLGICLGMQLLMDSGEEFGQRAGLGLVSGHVEPLKRQADAKVPNVGWRPIRFGASSSTGGLLQGLSDGCSMYFMHSFVVRPADPAVICSTTAHGQDMFCSMLQCRNVYGTQFHPERSGEAGLRIYRNLMAMADDRVCREEAGCEV